MAVKKPVAKVAVKKPVAKVAVKKPVAKVAVKKPVAKVAVAAKKPEATKVVPESKPSVQIKTASAPTPSATTPVRPASIWPFPTPGINKPN
ncbi:MAG: histone-like protein 2 [Betaproteobacteria bacterium]|nr:histone-like protein 2 [Betaproteobacteria bacterium]